MFTSRGKLIADLIGSVIGLTAVVMALIATVGEDYQRSTRYLGIALLLALVRLSASR